MELVIGLFVGLVAISVMGSLSSGGGEGAQHPIPEPLLSKMRAEDEPGALFWMFRSENTGALFYVKTDQPLWRIPLPGVDPPLTDEQVNSGEGGGSLVCVGMAIPRMGWWAPLSENSLRH